MTPNELRDFQQHIRQHGREVEARTAAHVKQYGPCRDAGCVWPAFIGDLDAAELDACVRVLARFAHDSTDDRTGQLLIHLQMARLKLGALPGAESGAVIVTHEEGLVG